jgi:glucose/arabinose dehydrogenase
MSGSARLAAVCRVVVVSMLALTTVATVGSGSRAASLPDGFVDAQIASGLTRPTAMAIAPDGRLFVAEQGGSLRVIENGSLLATPFVQLDVDPQGERGLLGVAFDPAFATNHYVYVYYTAKGPTVHNRVSRFTADGNVAVPGSEEIILELDDLDSFLTHNGGDLHFGGDGKLYIAVGDNSSSTNAQSLTTLKGKLLRINPDGTIPEDNPFYGSTAGRNRAIWALGLRNPFTFAIRQSTGTIFINDVGQNAWEEIDEGAGGANYGWPETEGYTSDPRYTSPVYAYGHASGAVSGCAITGGGFYDPDAPTFPSSYLGDYFFADYCAGWIKHYDRTDGSVSDFADGIASPVDLEISDDGALYYLARGSASVHRIRYQPQGPPGIVAHPSDQVVLAGEDATFEVVASGAEPLVYQWQRNGVAIPGATSSTYTLSQVTQGDDGALFEVLVTNEFGTETSNAARLSVAGGHRPTASITTPASGSLYSAGNTISYSGSADDAEDGQLAGAQFTWWVDFHHGDHTHPFLPPTTGSKTGSFKIPTTGETSSNVWYRIHLEVKDSSGLTDTALRDIVPRTSNIALDTSPSGLKVALDGRSLKGPTTTESVVGMVRWLSAVSPQDGYSTTYEFDSWSDGKTAAHQITTPSKDKTFTAVYRPGGGNLGTGAGLSATYFNGMSFGGTTFKRTDQTVNFDWGKGRPASPIAPDTFSVRWTGRVKAQFGESYTLCVRSDQGARLWIDGAKVIDHWTAHTVSEKCTVKPFAAGSMHSIRVDYYEGTGAAVAQLLWSSPSTQKQAIPSSQLYPQ